MKKTSTLLALLVFLVSTVAQAAADNPHRHFPTLDEQLKAAHARKGTALEKLILRGNFEALYG